MCRINPDVDVEFVRQATAAMFKASTAGDIDSIIEYMRVGIKSEFLRRVVAHAKSISEDRANTLYALAKGYVYVSYISAMIDAAINGITTSPYHAGWYYPPTECCQALNAIKSAWLHFLATTNIPLRDVARAWISAILYEYPCRVSAAVVTTLRSMQDYLATLAFDASI
jgi:hypothetical protein